MIMKNVCWIGCGTMRYHDRDLVVHEVERKRRDHEMVDE